MLYSTLKYHVKLSKLKYFILKKYLWLVQNILENKIRNVTHQLLKVTFITIQNNVVSFMNTLDLLKKNIHRRFLCFVKVIIILIIVRSVILFQWKNK